MIHFLLFTLWVLAAEASHAGQWDYHVGQWDKNAGHVNVDELDNLLDQLTARCRTPAAAAFNDEAALACRLLLEDDQLDKEETFNQTQRWGLRPKREAAEESKASMENVKDFGVDLRFVAALTAAFKLRHAVVVLPDATLPPSAAKVKAAAEEFRAFGDADRSLCFLRASSVAMWAAADPLGHRGAVGVVIPSILVTTSLKNVSNESSLRGEIHWFAFEEEEDSVTLSSMLALSVESNVYALKQEKNDTTIAVEEIYKVQDSAPVLRRKIASWTFGSGKLDFEESISKHKWERRSDLTGLHLRAVTLESPPYVFLDKSTMKMTGLMSDIWRELQTATNFTYSLDTAADGTWGTRRPDGTFGGLVGMLANDLADVAVADLYSTADRAKVADSSTVIFSDTNVLMVRRPFSGVPWNVFFQPFASSLWVAFGCTVLVTSLVFFLVHLVSNFMHSKGVYVEGYDYTLLDGLFLAVIAFSLQGYRYPPLRTSTRMVFFIIYAIFFICYEAYEASMFSFLIVRRPWMPFNDLKSLIEDTDLTVTSVEGTAYEFWLEHGDATEKKVWIERYESSTTLTEGLRKMSDGDNSYALMWALPLLNYEAERMGISCDVERLKANLPRGDYVIMMKKDFPYKKIFDHYLVRMIRTGWLDRLASRWRLNTAPFGACRQVDEGADDEGKVFLGLGHLWVAFAFLAGAWAVGCGICGGEWARAGATAAVSAPPTADASSRDEKASDNDVADSDDEDEARRSAQPKSLRRLSWQPGTERRQSTVPLVVEPEAVDRFSRRGSVAVE